MTRSTAVALALSLAAGAAFAACGSGGSPTGPTTAATTTATAATTTTASSTTGTGGGHGGTGGAPAATATATTGGGAGGAGGHGGAGGMGGAACTPFPDPCGMCTFGACKDLYCACYAEPECSAAVKCLYKCHNVQCANNCFVAHGPGAASAVLVTNCAGTNCGPECNGAHKLSACEVCIAQDCPAQLDTCFGDRPCIDLVQCVRDNCPSTSDQTCVNACAMAHQAGISKALPLVQCANSKCKAECMNGF